MFHVSAARFYLRQIGPAAIDFKIGRNTRLFPDWMPGIVELELELTSSSDCENSRAIGVSGDWPAFAWLDKQPDVSDRTKLRRLLQRLKDLEEQVIGMKFSNPIDAWNQLHEQAEYLSTSGRLRLGELHEVELCEVYCLALLERAIIDGYCRARKIAFATWLQSKPFQAFFQNGSSVSLPRRSDQLYVRHTIGLADELETTGLHARNSLASVIERFDLQFFKIKVCGDLAVDLPRLTQIWKVLKHRDCRLTIDGNEAFPDPDLVFQFILELQRTLPELFERVLFLEQPLPRQLTLDPSTTSAIQRVATRIPLVIDEADIHTNSFSEAIKIGYSGTSHKNCKGILKSFQNLSLLRSHEDGKLFLSAEDLTNVPIFPLHQDLTVASCLGFEHIERNGHHYFPKVDHFPLPILEQIVNDYPKLYSFEHADNGSRYLTLKIEAGKIDVSDLHKYHGMGVSRIPPRIQPTTITDYLRRFTD